MSLGGEYYRATARAVDPRPALAGRHEVDVVVVGSGFAGLNTALGLAERGVTDLLVLEARRLGHGASGRNGGFVFAGFSRGEQDLLDDLGPSQARRLYQGSVSAVETIRKRIGQYGIDCAYRPAGVLWANWFRDDRILASRRRLLAEYFDAHWEWVDGDALGEQLRTSRYSAALFEREAFHFHPLDYLLGLADAAQRLGVRLHEDSPVTSLQPDGAGWRLLTDGAEIRARRVVLACGGYLSGLVPKIDRAVLPIATYVMVTEPLGDQLKASIATESAVYDTRFAFDYYRPLSDTRLLWGGRISVLDRSPAAVAHLLRRDLRKVYPALADVRVDYAWSGLMSYARHEMPQVGEVMPGLWVAQAFGGHGVATTTWAGEHLASILSGGDSGEDWLAEYGLVSAFKPWGFLGAQATYSWLQFKDALRGRFS